MKNAVFTLSIFVTGSSGQGGRHGSGAASLLAGWALGRQPPRMAHSWSVIPNLASVQKRVYKQDTVGLATSSTNSAAPICVLRDLWHVSQRVVHKIHLNILTGGGSGYVVRCSSELVKCLQLAVYRTPGDSQTVATSLLTPAEVQQLEHALQIAQVDGRLRCVELVIGMWLKGQALSAASVADARSAVLLCGWLMCCELHKIGAD